MFLFLGRRVGQGQGSSVYLRDALWPLMFTDTPAVASRVVLSSSRFHTVRPSDPNTANAGETL